MALGSSTLTVAGVLILLLVVIFGIGVVSLQCCFNACYYRRRAQQQQQQQQASSSQGALPVATTTVYRRAARSDKDAVECVVCLAELRDGEEARFLPCCNQVFHALCLDTWLASQSTCPLCRINVVVERLGMAAVPALALPPVLRPA